MKKKLDTRFPAARIKKIMQADEDVGKIAMAVPLLVSKALELFLQDLCNRTHEITLKRGAKTVNSLHLKHCVQTSNMFDFLREIVSKVPDLGDADTAGEDHAAPKRRKVIEDGENDGDNESRRSRGSESIRSGSTIRGRGKGRGQGRGQGARGSDGDISEQIEKFEGDADLCDRDSEYPERASIGVHQPESQENAITVKSEELPDRNFDLNVGLDENGDSKPMIAGSASGLSANTIDPEKHEDRPGWSLSEVEKMAIDPLQLANCNSRAEDEDDYDEES